MLLKEDKNDWRGNVYTADICLPSLTYRDIIDTAAANVGHDATPEEIKKELNAILRAFTEMGRENLNNCINEIITAVKEER